MAITIGSNLTSLGAIRRLNEVMRSQESVFQRLSSGARINRASDDPAGLSVSSRLQANSRIFNRARLNLSDASSLLQIADGTASQISSLLTRMGELAEQASNGSLNLTQRRTLDKEYQALDQEIRRLSAASSFNGLSLLKGKQSSRGSIVAITDPNSFAGGLAISGDGRYATALSPDLDFINLHDSQTGHTYRIQDSSGNFTYEAAAVLANGDVIFSAVDASIGQGNLYYYDRASGQSRALTTGGYTNSFAVSADGSTVVFGRSGNYQALNVQTGEIKNTGISTFVTSIMVSADGSKVVGGFLDALFIASSSGGQYSLHTEVTGSLLTLRGVSNEGRVFFTSNANLAGTNPSSINQLFEYSTSGYRQLTFSSTALNLSTLTVSSDGSRLFLASTSNLTGENTAARRQLFSLEIASGAITQNTNYTGVSPLTVGVILSADGGRAWGFAAGGTELRYVDTTAESSIFDFEAGFGAAGNIAVALEGISSAVRGLGAFSLVNTASARGALDRITTNIQLISQFRGTLGAGQSRLTVGENLLIAQREESIAADSRIRDADVGMEAAALTQFRIRSQVAASLLAQTNLQPQLALRLLSNI